MPWELEGLEGDVSLGWGGGEVTWSRPPRKSLSSNSSALQRETLLTTTRLGKTPAATPEISTGQSRLLPGNSACGLRPRPTQFRRQCLQAAELPRLSPAMPAHPRL